MQIAFKSRKLHSHVFVRSLEAEVALMCVQKYFWSPQEQNGIQVSWPSTVGWCHVWQEEKRADAALVEGKSHCCAREWVWPGGRHCFAQLLICSASSTNGPLLIICLLTDSAVTFHELRPRRPGTNSCAPSWHTHCCNRHNSGKVNCLKLKQAGDLLPRPDKVLNEWSSECASEINSRLFV